MRFIKYYIFTIIVLGGFFFISIKETPQTSPHLFDKNNQASDDVVRLLGLTGIRIKNDPLPPEQSWPEAKLTLKSRSLEEITDAVQGKIDPNVAWKKTNTQERWQMKLAIPLSKDQLKNIQDIGLNRLGLAQEINPKVKHYKGVLFLGSTLTSVRQRLAYLNKLIDSKNFTFYPVYVLSGERTPDKAIGETQEALCDPNNGEIQFREDWKGPVDFPNNETDMIKVVFDQSKNLSLKNEDVIFVHTLKKEGQIRATTETTVYQWLEQCRPEAGVYLAISNQPYVLYQEVVIQASLLKAGRRDIQVEVVGPAKSSKLQYKNQERETAVLLDTLSRIFYEMVEIKKLSGK